MPYALEQLAAEVLSIADDCRHRSVVAVGFIELGGDVVDALGRELDSPAVARAVGRDVRAMITLRGGLWRLGQFYLMDARRTGEPVPRGAARFDLSKPDGKRIVFSAIAVELSE